MSSPRVLIILTTGPEDRGSRATLAFASGVSSLISGVETTIFLTMGGTFWSRVIATRTVEVEGFEPLSTYVSQYLELGGKVAVCSPCNDFYCSIADDDDLLPGAELTGLTAIVDEAIGATTLTF